MAFAAEKIDPLVPAIEPSAPFTATPGKPPRIVSLDVFRGLAIAAMILVNNPGDWDNVYRPLAHAEWDGWTMADLVFPFFVFIVGVAITLSLGDAENGGGGRSRILVRVLRRTVLLFALGLFLNSFMGFEGFAKLRILGVLQRIALCDLAGSLVFLAAGPLGQALSLVGLLGGYWLALAFIPVPGYGAGALDPEGNLAAFLDRRLLGEPHLYHTTWDPEGLLSTLPAIGTTLAGVLAGHWLRTQGDLARKSFGLVGVGVIAAALGWLLGLWLPINKSLWTSSYAVFTAGLAAALFGVSIWLVDVRGIRRPLKPLIIFGVNPIAAYVLSSMGSSLMEGIPIGGAGKNLQVWLYENAFRGWAGPLNGSLLFAVSTVLFWFGVMSVFYRRKIFIRV